MLKNVKVVITPEGGEPITTELKIHAEAMQFQFTDTPEAELDLLAIGEFVAEISHFVYQEAAVK